MCVSARGVAYNVYLTDNGVHLLVKKNCVSYGLNKRDKKGCPNNSGIPNGYIMYECLFHNVLLAIDDIDTLLRSREFLTCKVVDTFYGCRIDFLNSADCRWS